MLRRKNSKEYVPLARRVYATRPSSKPSIPITDRKQSNRPAAYKLWTEEKIRLACEAVKCDEYTYSRAELEFGVPKSTIRDRISGKTLPGATSGPERYLTDTEEHELVHFIKECARVGYAKTRKQIITIVELALKTKRGPDASITPGWWYSFKGRHPELTIRTAEKLAYARAIAQDQSVLDHYFDLLEQTMLENEIISFPSRIFNVDESGFPLQAHKSCVVAEKGCKHPTTVTTGDKAQITVIACVNASGAKLPPMVIFDRKVLKADLTLNEVPETIYALTDNGWSNSEVFDIWFHNHFLAYAPTARPLLLLMDGHSSHYNPSTIKTAAAQQIILFCLPPHTTHIAQPLDVAAFGVLKQCWDEQCHQYMANNPGKVVTRFQFSDLFSRAWAEAMIPRNICAGFKAAGVYPLDSAAFIARTASSDVTDSPAHSSSLKFVPMYSPIAPKSRRTQSLTQEEEKHFQQRFEEGYDLSNDPKYISWLHIHHPDEAKRLCELIIDPTEESQSQQTASDVEGVIRKSGLSKLLQLPKLPAKCVPPAKKSCAKVLTSTENLKRIEQKEREKREKIELKEAKRREREAKREEKIQEKEKKKQNADTSIKFTPQEVKLFARRHENGYNLTIDSRYMLWLNSTYPDEAKRLRSKKTMERTVTSNEVGGTKDGSTSCEELSDDDQHDTLLTKSKNPKDPVSARASTCNTAKKGRNTSLCTTKGATSKQRSTQKKGEQASGSRLKKGGGSKSGSASLCTTKSATSKQRSTQKSGEPAGESRLMKASTKSGSLRVTRSQTQNSRNAKLCDSSTSRKKSVASTAAKACTIVTRSKKGCKQSPSPVPESDMSESSAIGSDYEEGEFPMSCIILVKLL